MNAPTEHDPFLTISEAAKYLNLHRNTLIKWTDLGLIPHYRMGQGRHRRFRMSELGKFLEESKGKMYGDET